MLRRSTSSPKDNQERIQVERAPVCPVEMLDRELCEVYILSCQHRLLWYSVVFVINSYHRCAISFLCFAANNDEVELGIRSNLFLIRPASVLSLRFHPALLQFNRNPLYALRGSAIVED
jgi:hypothetical protein